MEGQVPRRWVIAGWIALGTCGLLVCGGIVCQRIEHSRSQARDLQSICHLNVIGLAVHCQATDADGYLPANEPDSVRRSWRIDVLPYLDRSALAKEYDRTQSWNAGSNVWLGKNTWIRLFDAPQGDFNLANTVGWQPCDYGMISGPRTAHPDDRAVTLDEIAEGDGLGNTLMLGECVGLRLGWTEPRDPRVDREQMSIEILARSGQTSNRLLSTYTTTGVPVGFADAGARFLSARIDPKVLEALCTMNGSEQLNQYDYLKR